MTIPDEAVEAAAEAMWSRCYGAEHAWSQVRGECRNDYLADARAALQAAAPLMFPDAWKEAHVRDWTDDDRVRAGYIRDAMPNPNLGA